MLRALAFVLFCLFPASAFAQAALSCAVEWESATPTPEALCEAIGKRLGRSTRRVPDARAVKKGESVQVLDGDVFWTAVWLKNGTVQSYTRVSKTMAQGKELDVLTGAVATLSKSRPRPKKCLRVEPNGGRRMRSPDLAYPWVELKACETSRAEVPDPWVTD